MQKIKISLWGLLALLTVLWLTAESSVFQWTGYFAFRANMVQHSGVIAMGCMSVAMILALRPRWPACPAHISPAAPAPSTITSKGELVAGLVIAGGSSRICPHRERGRAQAAPRRRSGNSGGNTGGSSGQGRWNGSA